MGRELLGVILLGSAIYDWRERRIPNWWIFLALLSGIGLQGIRAETGVNWDLILRYLLFAGGTILLCWPLFRFRLMGAGDIKLLSIIFGFLGLEQGLFCSFFAFLIGSVYGCLQWYRRRLPPAHLFRLFACIRQTIVNEKKPYSENFIPHRRRIRVPMAPCFFLGYLILLLFVPGNL